MTSSRTILYLGTYERDYPRNQQLIRLLRDAGCRVVEIHEPFWEHFRDKSRGVHGISGAAVAVLRLLRAYALIFLRLIPQLRGTDAVMIGYIGQLDMLVLAPVFRILRIPVLFNPLVTLTDTVVEDRGLVASGSVLARVVRLVDAVSLKLASAIIADTPQNASYMTERFGVPSGRVWSINVGADESMFPYVESRGHRNRNLHVLFYGKMIPLHGIETILSAIERLFLSDETGLCFEIVGSGQLGYLVHAFCVRYPEAPVVYRHWVAYRRLPQRIASADVVLGIFGSGDKAARVIPNKVFQAMATGSAVVTRDSPAVGNVLRDGESALLVPPADPDALVAAILKLRDDSLRGRLGTAARAAFEQWGSDRALGADLRDLLDTAVPVHQQANTRERRT